MKENESIRRRFEQHVEGIQQIAQMSFYENILSILIEKGGLKPGDRVLDVGSGPGWLAIKAARRVGQDGKVFGIDIAAGMLERAVRNASAEGTGLNCEFKEGSALEIPFPNEAFDVVLSNFVLHALSEAEKQVAIGEFYRVLKTNGRVVICDAVLSEDAINILSKWSEHFPASERDMIRHLAGHLNEWNLTSAEKFLEMFRLTGFKDIERIEEKEKIMPVLCVVKASKQ